MSGATTSFGTSHPLRSFRERNVRIYFGGMGVSGIGTWAHNTAVVLLIRELGGGGLELGIAAACQFGPMLLFGLYAGAVADRVERLRWTLRLQTLLGLSAVALAVTVLTDVVTIPIVFVLTGVFGLLTTFDNPARRTLATEMVPAPLMGNILSLSTSVMTGSRIVGPALAALVAAGAGTEWVFLGNGVSYLVFVIAMTRLDRSRFHPIERAPKSATPVRDGLREVWSVPTLRITLVVFAVISTFAFNHTVSLPLIVADRLGREASTFGLLLSVMSVGSVLGALTVARADRVPVRWMFVAGGVLGVTLGVIALSTTTWLTFAVAVPFGMSTAAFVNSSTIITQQHINPAMRSRVLALTTVIFAGSTPIGGPITGVIGDTFGAAWAALYGAIIALAAVGIGAAAFRWPVRRGVAEIQPAR